MIKRLLMLNGLAAVCAVINHAVVWDLTVMYWWTDRYMSASQMAAFEPTQSWRFFSLRVIDQLVIFAVFAFLFISGYFIAVAAGREQRSIPWRLVFQRIKFLVFPYLLWTGVLLAFRAFQGQVYTPAEVARLILLGGASPPYYYVIVLVQLYLLSPLLVPFARERWKGLLAVAAFLQLLSLAATYLGLLKINLGQLEGFFEFLRDWHLPGYAFWFVLGLVVGVHLREFRPMLARWRWFLLAGLLLGLAVGFVEWGFLQRSAGRDWISPQILFFNRVYILFFLLSFVAFEQALPPLSSLMAHIGPKSYGIYLVHVLPLELTARVLYHVAPLALAHQWLFLPAVVVSGVAAPLILMEIVNRSLIRPYYKYVFG